MDALSFKAGIHCMFASQVAGKHRLADKPSASAMQPPNPRWAFTLRQPLRPLWPKSKNPNKPAIAADNAILGEEKEKEKEKEKEDIADNDERSWKRKGNWVLKILHVNSLWKEDEIKLHGDKEQNGSQGNNNSNVCVVDDDDYDDDNDRIEFDQESFSKLLRKVSLGEARLYARMSYLGKLAYSIPQIKPGNLLRYHGLSLVTSSVEKKGTANETGEVEEKDNISSIAASAAYQIAASAASYLHSRTRRILAFRSSSYENSAKEEVDGSRGDYDPSLNGDVASLMEATDSVTAVVAANEEVKQAVVDDLNSTHSTPCEWFVCDEDQSATRYFVIQGSDSLASWQANLLFEPIQFEGLDVLVHRGIYEAAKGIYDQMLPEVHMHLKSHGNRARFYFTGHSLGGSLSLLINLMLLIREEVPKSSLLPVVVFGAPSIMCGGDHLLRKLGLPRNHVQWITMHRDIVPRAFSCRYPSHIAEFLKAINGSFRSLSCLSKQKLLYNPIGEFLILQPDDKVSPSHNLLPRGSGLYRLTCDELDMVKAEKQIQAAQAAFLNSPHPLEILSDRSAYGFGGTIIRDHDMNSYLKSIRYIIRQELSHMRKTKREHRRKTWWEVLAPVETSSGVTFSKSVASGIVMGRGVLNFYDVVNTGRESLKRFSRLIASQHMHLVAVLLFPAKLLILGTFSFLNYRH